MPIEFLSDVSGTDVPMFVLVEIAAVRPAVAAANAPVTELVTAVAGTVLTAAGVRRYYSCPKGFPPNYFDYEQNGMSTNLTPNDLKMYVSAVQADSFFVITCHISSIASSKIPVSRQTWVKNLKNHIIKTKLSLHY